MGILLVRCRAGVSWGRSWPSSTVDSRLWIPASLTMASAREETASFAYIPVKWNSMVRTETPRRRAICLLLMPRMRRSMTAVSRSVKRSSEVIGAMILGMAAAAQRPRDEPPGQPTLVSRRNRHLAGRVGSIELLGAGLGGVDGVTLRDSGLPRDMRVCRRFRI